MKLADSVLARIVQIVQESMLLGVDASDAMRMIELAPSETNSDVLVLTEHYKSVVVAQHEKLLAFAEQEQQKKQQSENN